VLHTPFHRRHPTRTFMHSLLSRPAFMDTCSGVFECTVIATPLELIKYRPSTLPHRCLPTCPVMKGDISTLPNWTGHAMPNVLPPPYLHNTSNTFPITELISKYIYHNIYNILCSNIMSCRKNSWIKFILYTRRYNIMTIILIDVRFRTFSRPNV